MSLKPAARLAAIRESHQAGALLKDHTTDAWAVGEMLGRYMLIQRIGAGEMGEVWKAHEDRLDRTVAIKMLHGNAPTDETGREPA